MTKESNPDWLKTKPAEVEKIIIDLANKGNSPEKIGLILRDQHGIPKAKLLGKRISQIIKENNLPLKTHIEKTSEKIAIIQKHSEKHKHDYTAKKALSKKIWITSKA